MPVYTFINTKTDKEHTDYMTISEMEEYLSKNKHIRQKIMPINIVKVYNFLQGRATYNTWQHWAV